MEVMSAGGLLLMDIDAHVIPANPAKGEGAHVHYDMRFLFRLKKEAAVVIDAAESDDYMWASRDEFSRQMGSGRVVSKLPLFTDATRR